MHSGKVQVGRTALKCPTLRQGFTKLLHTSTEAPHPKARVYTPALKHEAEMTLEVSVPVAVSPIHAGRPPDLAFL